MADIIIISIIYKPFNGFIMKPVGAIVKNKYGYGWRLGKNRSRKRHWDSVDRCFEQLKLETNQPHLKIY